MEHLFFHSHSLLFSQCNTHVICCIVLLLYILRYHELWFKVRHRRLTGKKSLMSDVKISATRHPIRQDFSFQSNCSIWNHFLQIKLVLFLKRKRLHCKQQNTKVFSSLWTTLTHFWPVFPFYTSWKHQKTSRNGLKRSWLKYWLYLVNKFRRKIFEWF